METVLDILNNLKKEYEDKHPIPEPPQKRRRKTDRRTLAKHRREKKNAARERGDDKRLSDGQLKEQFFNLRREIKRRRLGTVRAGTTMNTEWELTLRDWILMWSSCPAVEVGKNCFKPAWLCRGRNSNKDVQVRRIDPSKPYRKDNMMISKGKDILWVAD